VTSKQRFEPAAKYRIDLKYPRYVTKAKENRLFPAQGAKEIDPSKPVTNSAFLTLISAYTSSTAIPIIGTATAAYDAVL
jgi:hypothetical protein